MLQKLTKYFPYMNIFGVYQKFHRDLQPHFVLEWKEYLCSDFHARTNVFHCCKHVTWGISASFWWCALITALLIIGLAVSMFNNFVVRLSSRMLDWVLHKNNTGHYTRLGTWGIPSAFTGSVDSRQRHTCPSSNCYPSMNLGVQSL